MDMKICESFIKKIIEEANENQTKQIQEAIKGVTFEITEIKATLSQEIKKRKEIEEKYNQLHIKYNTLEKQSRKNNIIIFGLKHELTENKDQDRKQKLLNLTISNLDQYLDITIDPLEINDICTLGKQKANNPILLKFCCFIRKQHVLKSCKKLKGTDIIISDDLSPEERRQKAVLNKYLKEARLNKHIAHIKGNKLYIDRKPYSIDELNQLPKEKNFNKVSEDLEYHTDDEEYAIEEKGNEEAGFSKNTIRKESQREVIPESQNNKKLETKVLGIKLRSETRKK